MVQEICDELGALAFRSTTDATERRKLWHARHHSYEIMVRSHPGFQFFIMDVAVPISAYPQLITYVEALKKEYGVDAYMIGHAGDGNIHVEFPYRNQQEFDRSLELDKLIVNKALDLGGTATGEHGVGMGKSIFMEREHGESLNVMRAIKQTLDPTGILNPGKIFPETVPAGFV
jgi:D-lactate dehydrogenase (cytochrome)